LNIWGDGSDRIDDRAPVKENIKENLPDLVQIPELNQQRSGKKRISQRNSVNQKDVNEENGYLQDAGKNIISKKKNE